MELQRTGYGPKIALAAIFATLIVAYDIFVLVYLAIAGRFADFWSFDTLQSAFSALLVLLVTIAIILNARSQVKKMRLARALAERAPSQVEEASPQPEPTRALSPGETLTLTHRYSLRAVYRSLTTLLTYIFLVAYSEAAFFQALPAFGRSPLNPLYDPQFNSPAASAPTALDWLAVALLIVLAVSLMSFSVWHDLRDRFHQVVADDDGLTVRNGLRRRHMRWRDIELFARIVDEEHAAPAGSYVVWGRAQALNFPVAAIEEGIDSDTDHRSLEGHYRFDGGYAAYVRDAQRLLATIAARARTPLLALHEQTQHGQHGRHGEHDLRRQRRGAAPAPATLSEAEALALPLAEQRYLPLEDQETARLHDGEQLTLRAPGRSVPVSSDPFGDANTIIMAFSISLWATLPTWRLSARWPVSLALLAVPVSLLVIYVVLFRRARRARQLPDVRADEAGLTTWGRYKDQPITLPWQRVTAWVVVPPEKDGKLVRYIVFGDGLRLTWAEPASRRYYWETTSGDPHRVYRQQAARLHALIAARAGLPLRELRTDATPAAAA